MSKFKVRPKADMTRMVKCQKCDEKVNLDSAIESRGQYVCPKCLCPLGIEFRDYEPEIVRSHAQEDFRY